MTPSVLSLTTELLQIYQMNSNTLFLCSHFSILYSFASTDVRVEREVWAISVISFISELGGALSLFLGVSFLSAWDLLDYCRTRYQLNCAGK